MNRPTRYIRLLLWVSTTLIIFGAFAPSLTANAATTDAPFDLAALAIRPSDTNEDGFARFSGQSCASAAGCVTALFSSAGPDEATLRAAKVRRGYYVGLSKPAEIQTTTQSDTIETTILEFADSAKAKAELGLVLSPLEQKAAPTASDAVPGAELIVATGPFEGNSLLLSAAGIRFRSGRLVIGIDYRFANGHEIDAAKVEALAKVVADRIAIGSDDPTLGSLIVHHMPSSYDAYDLIDGTIQPTFFGFGAQDQARADQYAESGATDVFYSSEDVVPSNMGLPLISMNLMLVRFTSAESASTFLDTTIANAGAQGDAVRPLDGAPALGEQSAAIAVSTGSTYSVQYAIRVGSVVALISWDRYMPTTTTADEQLGEAEAQLAGPAIFTGQMQVDCLIAGACPSMHEVPESLIPQA